MILVFLVEVERIGSYEIILQALAWRQLMNIIIAFNLSIASFS
jgi:hypothetical protein